MDKSEEYRMENDLIDARCQRDRYKRELEEWKALVRKIVKASESDRALGLYTPEDTIVCIQVGKEKLEAGDE